ncbi:MAG: efflux transporter outer membrane subunit [Pirellulaceae bacterium]
MLPTQHPPPFSISGAERMPDRWWTAFQDPALDFQVSRSLDGNFPLAAALQRLRAAQALARRESSDLWLDVDGVAEAEGTFFSAGENQSLFALGVDAGYQVDLWGEIRSRVEAERLRASATEADYHAIALTLSAEVARAWFALTEAHAQLALVADQIKTNETGAKLQEARFGLGQVRSADVLRQRQLVESTREQAVVVQSRIAVLEHRLAVLQGQTPQEATYDPEITFPDLPPLPQTGLPSELLLRRPDVRREFLALSAADRDLASAISAQYPRLNLAASITTAAESPEDLFQDWIGSVAGQLIAPLIDGGQRRAEVDRTTAEVRQRFAEYGQTVLLAYREVEDALARERYQIDRVALLELQLQLARQSSTQLREQYFIGDAAYLDVLSSITEEQRLQRTTLSARLDVVLTRVDLYLALAGGFDPRLAGLRGLAGGAGSAVPVGQLEPVAPPRPAGPIDLDSNLLDILPEPLPQ